MGNIKRTKKFKKNNPELVKQRKKKEFASRLSLKGAKKVDEYAKPQSKAKKSAFKVEKPSEKLLGEAEFEKYLSESESDASGSENDEDLALQEENDYLQGEDSADEEVQEKTDSKLTLSQVESWRTEINTSPKAIKAVIRAFANEDEITDFKALDELITLSLVPLATALSNQLPLNNNKMPVSSNKLNELTPVLKIYCKSLTELLKNGTNKRLPQILSSLQKVIPYFISLRKQLKELVKSFTSVIVNPNLDDDSKLQTFGIINECVTRYPNSMGEIFIKGSYESLVRLCGSTNAHTLPSINLAKNLFGMLYVIDPSLGYQLAFQQIRTLALHLKASLDKKKNPDTDVKVIYTWQYVQSLDFFSRVIAMGKEDSPLLQLVHPLVQVTLRTITLIPNAAYFPLRFYLVRSLIRLSRHTGVYIPLIPVLHDVLGSSAITKRGVKSSLNQFDFEVNIRAPESYLGTQVYQNGLSDELVDLYTEALSLYCKSISFPELAGPVTSFFKRFTKKSANAHLNRSLSTLSERLQANSRYILKHRSNVSFGPKDREQIAKFLKDENWEKTPLGSLAVVRRKVREDRQKLLRENQDSESEAGEPIDEDEDEEAIAELADGSSSAPSEGEDEESE